jgi:hypothetical protein
MKAVAASSQRRRQPVMGALSGHATAGRIIPRQIVWRTAFINNPKYLGWLPAGLFWTKIEGNGMIRMTIYSAIFQEID